MSECPQDMHAYWRLGEYLLRSIQHSTNPELAGGRAILHRLFSRDLFACAGEILLSAEQIRSMQAPIHAPSHAPINAPTNTTNTSGSSGSGSSSGSSSSSGHAPSPRLHPDTIKSEIWMQRGRVLDAINASASAGASAGASVGAGAGASVGVGAGGVEGGVDVDALRGLREEDIFCSVVKVTISVYIYICIYIHLSVSYLSVYIYTSISYLSVSIDLSVSVDLSVCIDSPICMYLSTYPSILSCLSIHPRNPNNPTHMHHPSTTL